MDRKLGIKRSSDRNNAIRAKEIPIENVPKSNTKENVIITIS